MINIIKGWSPVILVILGMACGSAITTESIYSSIKANTYGSYNCAPKAADNDKK